MSKLLTFLAGGATLVALTVAWINLYPWLFNLVHSLFQSQDLGTIAALVVLFFVTGPVVAITIGVTLFVIGLVSVFLK